MKADPLDFMKKKKMKKEKISTNGKCWRTESPSDENQYNFFVHSPGETIHRFDMD